MMDEMTEKGKGNISEIMDGTGEGPAMPVSETDPTGQKPDQANSIHDFMSNANLRPNKPGGNTRSF